ncbi:NADH-Ubiquinone/plastoquinone (complex I), domain protein [Methylocaldum marinum]|uniref:NADH-Ubiquinone/plastoquinone (Complex I), domain protein n=1 Tax=Methylocaldum marinum TaxID=1432792 RepID=A0A286P3E0_9GAMM|nr:proton-conducting transporter membrane subunit [Methylocaldum marinum]BBA32162.1 NADH-Ubiquinone/plastoquinone (complex I), domain protein [Methylocaldum marinum]
MSFEAWLPLLVVLSSFVTGVLILFVGEEQLRTRSILNLLGAIAKLLLVGVMVWGVFHRYLFETRLPMLPDQDFVLRADAMGMLFVSLSSVLWLLTTIYAIGYLEGSPYRSRFFGFFSLCVTSTMGIALAGDLITFIIFYELLTLSTYPLVVHRGTPEALRAGRVYLTYTITGGALLLVGVVWLYELAGSVEFTERGVLSGVPEIHYPALLAIFAILIAGLGVKTALVPLHGWLPVAMVAPAPVSALLHAVAVVKAGAFGIVRIAYDVYGVEFAARLGVLEPLAWLAGVTIVYGSIRALTQDDLKRRLAYSTVSQVSYIVLGIGILGPLATIGGVVHLVHQGLMKITLFFCAGDLAETLGIHKISEMNGVGRRMPWSMAAFTVAALGMIGIPPIAGFISKWYLGLGAVQAKAYWAVGVLAASTVLNAAYFLPILYRIWFLPAAGEWPKAERDQLETRPTLLVPTLATAFLAFAAGLFAGSRFSPLGWAKLIAAREYLT